MNAPINQATRTGAEDSSFPPQAEDSASGPVLLTDWRKPCRCCGRAHNWHQWNRLDFVGLQFWDWTKTPDTEDPQHEVQESRNCQCGSTLVVDLLEIVDLVRGAA